MRRTQFHTERFFLSACRRDAAAWVVGTLASRIMLGFSYVKKRYESDGKMMVFWNR